MKDKAVYIEWLDHCSNYLYGGGWVKDEDIKNAPCIIKSIGWILKEDKDFITLASCTDIEGDVHKNVSTIVKNCIVKRRRISL